MFIGGVPRGLEADVSREHLPIDAHGRTMHLSSCLERQPAPSASTVKPSTHDMGSGKAHASTSRQSSISKPFGPKGSRGPRHRKHVPPHLRAHVARGLVDRVQVNLRVHHPHVEHVANGRFIRYPSAEGEQLVG